MFMFQASTPSPQIRGPCPVQTKRFTISQPTRQKTHFFSANFVCATSDRNPSSKSMLRRSMALKEERIQTTIQIHSRPPSQASTLQHIIASISCTRVSIVHINLLEERESWSIRVCITKIIFWPIQSLLLKQKLKQRFWTWTPMPCLRKNSVRNHRILLSVTFWNLWSKQGPEVASAVSGVASRPLKDNSYVITWWRSTETWWRLWSHYKNPKQMEVQDLLNQILLHRQEALQRPTWCQLI